MPKPNYYLLCHFLCVLYNISRRSTHNLMSAANLGVCVGPSLLWADSPATCPAEDLRTVPALVEILITHCELLCGPHVPMLLGDPRDSGTEESDCECAPRVAVFDGRILEKPTFLHWEARPGERQNIRVPI